MAVGNQFVYAAGAGDWHASTAATPTLTSTSTTFPQVARPLQPELCKNRNRHNSHRDTYRRRVFLVFTATRKLNVWRGFPQLSDSHLFSRIGLYQRVRFLLCKNNFKIPNLFLIEFKNSSNIKCYPTTDIVCASAIMF